MTKHARLLRTASILALAILLALSVLWLLEDDRGGAVAAPGAQRDLASTAPTSADPELAGSKLAASTNTPSERASATDVLDGRRWMDVLMPLDSFTGVPLPHASVRHIDERGVLTERRLDEPIRRGDLAANCFAALDTGGHCPRFFVPSRLVAHTGSPLQVRLHPAGELRIERSGVSFDPEQPPTVDVRVDDPRRFEDGAWLDPQLELLDDLEPSRVATMMSVCRELRTMLDPSADAAWRARRAPALLGAAGLAPMFDFEGSPTVGGYVFAEFEDVRAYPIVLTDVPVGARLALLVETPNRNDVHVAALDPERGTDERRARNVWLDRAVESGRPSVAVVHFLGSASVRGRIAAHAESGRVDLDALLGNGQRARVASAELTAANGFEFAFEDVAPGTYVVAATWRERDPELVHARAQRRIELAHGDDADLGQLATVDGRSLSIVPVLEVDGARDDGLLGGKLESARLSLYVRERGGAESDAPVADQLDLPFAPVRLAGLAARPHVVAAPELELPPEVAEHYRSSGRATAIEVDLSNGDGTVELVFELRSTCGCELSATVPAAAEGVIQLLSAKAFDPVSGLTLPIELGTAWHLGDGAPFELVRATQLPIGTWTVVLVVQEMVIDEHFTDAENAPLRTGHVGRANVDVATGRTAHVHVPLDAATAARGPAAYFMVSESTYPVVGAVPLAFPDGCAELWGPMQLLPGPFVLTGLFPNTEHRVPANGRRFTTGAAGTTIELVD